MISSELMEFLGLTGFDMHLCCEGYLGNLVVVGDTPVERGIGGERGREGGRERGREGERGREREREGEREGERRGSEEGGKMKSKPRAGGLHS